MDAAKLRSKLRTFVTRRGSAADSDAGADIAFKPEELIAPAIQRQRDPGPDGETVRFPSDPLEDEEILAGVDGAYYEQSFDASVYELKKLPSVLDLHVINGDRQRLLRQMTVVTKRVFAHILERRVNCADEMQRVGDITHSIDDSLLECRAARRGLARARQEFTASSLGILAAYRRKQHALKLIEDLNVIRTLHRTDERLQELLSEDDFPGAIQLLLECRQAAETFARFHVVGHLAAKLEDTLAMAEEQLDVALAKVCVDFSASAYSRVHTAHRLLGKTQTAMDQMHMHVTSAIHNTAWNVVFGHAMLVNADNDSDLSKKSYVDLCGGVGVSSSVLPCLVDLCRALWNIMNSYRQIALWHTEEARCNAEPDSREEVERQYVAKKLETGKARIWQDVQTKVRVFVMANDLSSFSIDSFLEFVDVIHRLIEVGHAFCGSASDTLQESLKKQCWSYFSLYHASRLDELRMHLENEGWAACPVRPTFKATQLVEFSHLRAPSVSLSPKKKLNSISSPFDVNYDDLCDDDDDVLNGHNHEEAFYGDSDSDSEIADELKVDFVDERTGDEQQRAAALLPSMRRSHAPVLTTTSLLLLRLCGKYVRMMRALQPIAASVMAAMVQLLEIYVIAVHNMFTKDMESDSLSAVTSAGLSDLLARIRSELHVSSSPKSVQAAAYLPTSPSMGNMSNAMSEPSPLPTSASSPNLNSRVSTRALVLPDLCPAVDLSREDDLFGLAERVVAVESAVFVAQQFRLLEATIVAFLPQNKSNVFAQYETQVFAVLCDLRRPVYAGVSRRAVDADAILRQMAKVDWAVKEVSSQHSHYVDAMLKSLESFALGVDSVRRRVRVPADVRKVLWELVAFYVAHVFLEGFSSARRCSNEGRALMQLDFRQFVLKLDKMSEAKPVPYQNLVTDYVRAYYIPETDLEAWVKQHSADYTEKQLVSLVNCVAYNNNRTKQKLTAIVNEISGRIRR